MRHRRARRSGGPLGCLHAVIGFVACVGFVVGAWHVATDGASVEPAPPDVAIWSPAPEESTAEPTEEPSFMERPAGTAEPIDCADQEDPDLCVELGDEYIP